MQTNEAVRLNLYLPKTLTDWLKKQAEKDHRSLNNYLSVILENHKEKEMEACILAR